MSELFRCSECKYSDDAEWAKVCATTFGHKQQELNFLWMELIRALAKALRIDRLVTWMEKKLERWGK